MKYLKHFESLSKFDADLFNDIMIELKDEEIPFNATYSDHFIFVNNIFTNYDKYDLIDDVALRIESSLKYKAFKMHYKNMIIFMKLDKFNEFYELTNKSVNRFLSSLVNIKENYFQHNHDSVSDVKSMKKIFTIGYRSKTISIDINDVSNLFPENKLMSVDAECMIKYYIEKRYGLDGNYSIVSKHVNSF